MRPYSVELRVRVLAAVERGEHTLAELAQLFALDRSTILRWLQRYRKTGSYEPKPRLHFRPRALDAQAETRLRERVQKTPDATLEELRRDLGLSCSLMALWRALQRLGITRKKKTFHACERDRPAVRAQRERFMEVIAQEAPEHLIFVDETGTTTAMNRLYGRAPEGERVSATTPGAWKNVSMIAGLGLAGCRPALALEGAIDRAAFDTYVEQVLAPALTAGDVVIWDNLSAHKSAAAVAAIEARGARVEPLPPYSFDLNPIEEMFSKIKTYLRTAAERTTAGVMNALGDALAWITEKDIVGWFHDRCSYAMKT